MTVAVVIGVLLSWGGVCFVFGWCSAALLIGGRR